MLLAAIFAAAATGRTDAATRVALVGGETNAGLENVLDTSTALLSKDVDLQLLDRAEVGRVLREHELSLAGLEGAEHAVKAGQLLQADLFAVLEGNLTNEVGGAISLGLVVFDAKSGVRYADSALSASNAISAALATAEAVRAAVAKTHRGAGDLHTVGVLLVRNADMPRQFDGLCDTVGLLLERELTASPGIAVLERRRLEQVTKERSVARDAEGNRLLTSLRMIELDISRDGDGLRGTLALAGADGVRSAPITATVPTRDAATLAHLLADKTERFLNAPSDVLPANRAAEAARFHREYLLLRQHRDLIAAVHPLDAAIALAPEQTAWRTEMALLLFSAAIESSGDLASCLPLGQRGADLMLDLAREAAQGFKPGQPIPEALKDSNRSYLVTLLQKLPDVRRANPVSAAEIAALAGKERTLRMDIMEPFLSEHSLDSTSFRTYGQTVFDWFYPPSVSDERHHDDTLALRHWVEMSHKVNPPDGSGDYSPFERFGIEGFFCEYRGKEAEVFRQRLEQDQDPVIRLYARAGRVVSIMAEGGAAAANKVLAAEHEFRLYAQDLLARGDAEKSAPLRYHLWRTIETTLSLRLTPHPEAWREIVEGCRFALAQGRIEPNLFYHAAGALNDASHQDLPGELELLNRGLKLINEHPEAIVTNYAFRNEFIQDLQQKRDQLARELAAANTNTVPPSPWKQNVCLFDLAKPINGFAWLFKPVVQDGQVFALALGFHEWGLPEDSLQLVRVPLEGSPTSFLGRAKITGIEWNNRTSFLSQTPTYRLTDYRSRLDVGCAACVGAGCYFAATCSGIYIFPTNGGPVEHLGTTNGLPSDATYALTFLDGKLYIGAGEAQRGGYLATYEPGSRIIAILASSRRSERLSPFDDQPAFYTIGLVPDPIRQRLLMAVSQFNIPNGRLSEIVSCEGIWSYLPSTGEYKRLVPLRLPTFPSSFMLAHTWAGFADTNTLAVEGPTGLALFDLRNERLLAATHPISDQTNTPIELYRRPKPVMLIGDTLAPMPVTGPFLLRDGWFYSAHPFERMALADGTREQFPPLRTDYPFEPNEALQLMDDGKHVLAADQFSLWLLELNPEPARAPAGNVNNNSASAKPSNPASSFAP